MKSILARSAAALMLIAWGSAVILNAQSRRQPQRLLGVGTLPAAPAAAPSAADPFFDDSVLQELSLDINAKDWATLKENFESNAYYPADLRWRGQVVRNVGIRSRGTSSRSGTKPGLRVDFNRYSSGQTFLGLKSFVLRNNVTPDLHALYFNTLNAAAAAAIEPETEGGAGWMEREIDRELYQIKDAAIADPDKPFTAAEFDAAVNELVKFARERSEFVASEVDRLDDTDPYWAVP